MSDLKLSSIVKLAQTGNASFSAFRANRNNYAGLFTPLMGFDNFRLSSDVFGPHEHRHMSALSYLFDDSAAYHNKDSMGSDLTITPGSLLWTWAGSGVTHHEFPEKDNTSIHGLQLFLEIPAATRNMPPKSVLIPVEKMPVKETEGVHIKVVSGATNDLVNPVKTPEDITFLDLLIARGKTFQHQLPAGWNGTIYLLSGKLAVDTPAGNIVMDANDTIAVGAATENAKLSFRAEADCQLLFISGQPDHIKN
ncbi:pirin family protein [Chitinophaga agrisoli]|uniref:Pirin family protein n=1 Tax=Chitinophaga agrisoli TaxID=2607653 RepID=A0A5B2VJC4_9BACT|nr:pirin family protein [Chitinophaga agrisoli]KAA2238636.1 pirin family protein [Chitinophaga agrisoli]